MYGMQTLTVCEKYFEILKFYGIGVVISLPYQKLGSKAFVVAVPNAVRYEN
jgi:hypothetical protein